MVEHATLSKTTKRFFRTVHFFPPDVIAKLMSSGCRVLCQIFNVQPLASEHYCSVHKLEGKHSQTVQLGTATIRKILPSICTCQWYIRYMAQ